MSRVAVVTGGAAGMGLAIANRLATDGHAVAVFDIDGDAAGQAADAMRAGGTKALGLAVDVSDRAAVEAAIAGARRAWSDRHHGHERGHRPLRAVHGDQPRELGPHARGEPHGHVPLPAVRNSRHGRGRLGPHRHDLVVERTVGRAQDGALRRVEGGRHRPHQGARARLRGQRDHREHDPARLHRHPDGATRRGARRPAEHRGGRGPDTGPAAEHRKTSRRRARSSARRRRATSPGSRST